MTLTRENRTEKQLSKDRADAFVEINKVVDAIPTQCRYFRSFDFKVFLNSDFKPFLERICKKYNLKFENVWMIGDFDNMIKEWEILYVLNKAK